MCRAIQQVRLTFIGVPCPDLLKALHHPHELSGPIDHRHIDHLALPRFSGLKQTAHDAGDQKHTAAAKVTDQIQRHDGPLTPPTYRMERTRNRDIVEVVTRSLGERTLLPPSGHARKHQARISRQTLVRAKTELFTDAGAIGID